MRVLVVVDMQASYVAAQEPGLVTRIEQAMHDFCSVSPPSDVVLLSYDGAGAPTVAMPPGGGKIKTLWKTVDDGGDLVYSYLLGADLVRRDLSVTFAGVNLGACVFKSANQLAWRLYEEHALTDVVIVDTKLCGDGGRYKVRLV